MDNKQHNTTIMILMCTALAMLTMLTILNWSDDSTVAFAGSMQDRGGDYSITVAQLSSDQEAVWILDSRYKTVGVYLYDAKSKRLELRRVVSLAEVQAGVR